MKLTQRRWGRRGGDTGVSGMWKLAYADFTTAMMIFFLLMWMLKVADDQQREQLAEYFANKMEGPSPQAMLKKLGDLLQQRAREQGLERNIGIKLIEGGMKIILLDNKDQAMFALGKSTLLPHTERILTELAALLNDMPYPLVIMGYTDARPLKSRAGYGNWELSSDRGHNCRRFLIQAGLDSKKIVAVIGKGDTDFHDQENPMAAANRRVELVIRYRNTNESKLYGSNPLPVPLVNTNAPLT